MHRCGCVLFMCCACVCTASEMLCAICEFGTTLVLFSDDDDDVDESSPLLPVELSEL